MIVKNQTHRCVCALVLGGYINSYNIVRELAGMDVSNIVLLDYEGSRALARASRYIDEVFYIRRGCSESLLSALRQVHERFDYLVLFPTDDMQCQILAEIYDLIKGYCFVPFNPNTLLRYSDKIEQYKACSVLGIPCPKTRVIDKALEWDSLLELSFPILIKPNKRQDSRIEGLFRNHLVQTPEDLSFWRERLRGFVQQGVVFLASEVIPGDGSAIYSYMAYRDAQGRILNEWVGKKLSQYPNDFGVFASASNQCPDIVAEQGRTLIHGLDLQGISQPEFKYDYRDGTYKLMEINLRSMMWHRLGYGSGVPIHATQYSDAIGLRVPCEVQNRRKTVHLIYMKHELLNLVCRKGYWRTFIRNCFGSARRAWAVWEPRDPYPFLVDSWYTARVLAGMLISKFLSALRFRKRDKGGWRWPHVIAAFTRSSVDKKRTDAPESTKHLACMEMPKKMAKEGCPG